MPWKQLRKDSFFPLCGEQCRFQAHLRLSAHHLSKAQTAQTPQQICFLPLTFMRYPNNLNIIPFLTRTGFSEFLFFCNQESVTRIEEPINKRQIWNQVWPNLKPVQLALRARDSWEGVSAFPEGNEKLLPSSSNFGLLLLTIRQKLFKVSQMF